MVKKSKKKSKAKKVKAIHVEERVKDRFHKKSKNPFDIGGRIVNILLAFKIAVAICLDLVDLVLANIPILNTLWDFFTFIVLSIILRNKWLAVVSLSELPLVGIPLFGQIDALLPIATVLTLVDIMSTKTEMLRKRKK